MSLPKSDIPQLKEGFTSGTACAAAAKAAALVLAGGPVPDEVDTPLPLVDGQRGRLTVPVNRVERLKEGVRGPTVRGVVIKDAGHDPDATHGAEFHALVQLIPAVPGVPAPETPPIMLRGGLGVGKVTLPGLPVAPGGHAINPEPREQIEFAVREGLAELSQSVAAAVTAIAVTIEVPQGEALAKRTMNPRLGIVGGISILGRSGIVRPYSHDAFLASVSQGLDVAKALGADTAWLTTGRKSERLLQGLYPDLSTQAMVQCADLFAEGTAMAARAGFRRIGWALFFGKLVKQAQGAPNTHAHRADVDLALVSRLARELGAPDQAVQGVLQANTARHALELLRPTGIIHDLAARLVTLAQDNALGFLEKEGITNSEVLHVVFDYDESRLA